jgi:hypothetical protein
VGEEEKAIDKDGRLSSGGLVSGGGREDGSWGRRSCMVGTLGRYE